MTSTALSEQSAAVEADLNYLLYTGARPVSYTFVPPPGIPQQSGELLPQRVRIENGRGNPALSLHQSGFELRRAPSTFSDFGDDAAIRSNYYLEAEGLLREVTGAEKVVIFDHTLRYGAKGHEERGVREPVRRVHNDQTLVSGPRRVRDHLPSEEAEQRLRRRFAIINVWRPIGASVQSAPLALCDARSITAAELVPTDLVYPDKVGEVYSFVPSPAHRWYYFPEVSPEEVILIKIYDSLADGKVARLTAHTAFDDPRTPADAPPRRSIELRCLVFYSPDA